MKTLRAVGEWLRLVLVLTVFALAAGTTLATFDVLHINEQIRGA